MLGWILFGLLVGCAAFTLAVTVAELIKKSNIGAIIRRELAKARNKAASKMLVHTIKAKIKSRTVNVVSLDAVDEDTGEVIEISLTSEAGVDDSIRTMDEIRVSA